MNKQQIIYMDNKPHIKCDVVMLFSPKGGNLFSIEDSELIKYSEKVLYENILHQIHPFNLHTTSDEEIKEGEYGIDIRGNKIFKCERLLTNHYECGILQYQKSYCRKIIATTDTSLTLKGEQEGENTWYNPLPQLSQQFIEKYIEEYNKGNKITEVLVEVEEYEFKQTEWFQEAPYTHKYKEWRLKLDSQNQITIRKQKDSWSREEVIDLISDWTKMKSGLNMNLPNNFNQWIAENL